MDTIIPIFHEKQNSRDAEYSRHESQQIQEHASRQRELENLREETHRYVETIGKNFNFITGHRHAISKVVHESKQCNGLNISNKYHKQTLNFMNDAVAFVNEGKNLYTKLDAGDNIDNCKLSDDARSCAQSTSDVFKGIQSSVIKVETLMQNMHVIIDQYNGDESNLERSVFDEQ